MLLIDSLLFFLEINSNPSVNVYSLLSEKKLAEFCKRGRGPGELIYPFSIQFDTRSHQVYVHDLNGKKVVFYAIEKILKSEINNHVKITKIDSVYPRKLVVVKDGNFFTSLMGHPDGMMNCIIDHDGKMIKKLNNFPPLREKYDFKIASNLFATNINCSPDQTKIIISYSDWPWLEIFDSEGNEMLKIEGPDFRKVELLNSKGYSGYSISLKNIRRFWYPEMNNDCFMIPYSGKTRQESMEYDILLHMDYEGNPICQYVLDPPISDIQIDWTHHIIYGLKNSLVPTLIRYKF